MKRRRGTGHVSHPIQRAGIGLFGLGLGLLLASAVLTGPGLLRPVAAAMRAPAPYLIAIGLMVALLGWALRPQAPAARPARRPEPTWFPNDSTDFARSTVVADPSPPAEHLARTGHRAPADTWCMQVFDDIEWRRFEALCAELFAQAGFEPRTQSHGADGGVDIWLHSRNSEGPAAVVQCKHWSGKPVGVKEMREFLGVMASRKLARGTYATTSTFTGEALRFARENGIHTLDGAGLLGLIARRTPEQQQRLLELAYEGEYWRPTCASCGQKMVDRSARQSRQPFWGCADFPRCRFTLPMRRPA